MSSKIKVCGALATKDSLLLGILIISIFSFIIVNVSVDLTQEIALPFSLVVFIFSLIIILKQVLTEEDFSLMMSEISYEIDVLDGKLEVIGIEKILFEMGFPINYKEIVRVD